jgi:dephospho-CoA kinase
MGRMRSGKDVAAAYLAQQYGYTQFAFGDELKRYAHELFGEPAPGTKPRELYQWFGQTMRERDPDVWVRKCLEFIAAFKREIDSGAHTLRPNVVISDCRQPNEYAALKAAGYVFIRVECPDHLRIQRAIDAGDTFTAANLAHDTETALDGYSADFTVHNDGTLDELYAQIDEIAAYLTGEWPE